MNLSSDNSILRFANRNSCNKKLNRKCPRNQLLQDLIMSVLGMTIHVMRDWYHLYNLKDVKNTHGGVLL